MNAHSFSSSLPPFTDPDTPSRGALKDDGKSEIRLFGLEKNHTTPALIAFFSQMATVHGVLRHPSPDAKQWAQLWVGGEEEAEQCMQARAQLEASGVTMARFPAQNHVHPTPAQTPTPYPSDSVRPRQPPTPSHFPPLYGPLTVDTPYVQRSESEAMSDLSLGPLPYPPGRPIGPARHDIVGPGYRHYDQVGSLPRNLYIVDLPLDMSETQFRALFQRHGCVEHCKLLSQLDGSGRRRGFILMASHREALEAMRNMHGLVMEGSRIDVSWALVQREARHFGSGIGAMPNRVIHPPIHPLIREAPSPPVIAAVIVEGLDPQIFSSATVIRELFSTFGTIQQASLLSSHPLDTSLTAVIQFENALSEELLVQASGMTVGTKTIYVRHFQFPSTAHQIPSISRGPYAQQSRYEEHGMIILPQQSRPWLPPSTPILPAQHQQRLTFNPFSSESDIQGRSRVASYDSANSADQITAQSRLNATSSPFIPNFTGQDIIRTPQAHVPAYLQQLERTQQDRTTPVPHRINRDQYAPAAKTPSPPPPTTSRDDVQPQPRSSPSTGRSSDTIVSAASSGGQSHHTGSRSTKLTTSGLVGLGINGQEDEASMAGGIGANLQMMGMGKTAGVTSRMHDRWLKASMSQSGNNKWF